VLLLIGLAESVTQGLIIGGLQWFVLRHYTRGSNGWIAATVVAWTFYSCALFGYNAIAQRYLFILDWIGALGYSGQLLMFAEVEGLILGLAQWITLRRWGGTTIIWILIVISARVASLIVGHLQVYAPVATVLSWVSEGLVTGAGIAYLLKENWPSVLKRHLAHDDVSDATDLKEPAA
jgi:hypothetical protein